MTQAHCYSRGQSNPLNVVEVPPALMDWCHKQLPPRTDANALVPFIYAIERVADIADYLQPYMASPVKAGNFAEAFAQKRKLVQQAAAGNQNKQTGSQQTNGGQADPQPKASRGKKKKKKSKNFQQVDRTLLSFSVTSGGGANRGEIDHVQ